MDQGIGSDRITPLQRLTAFFRNSPRASMLVVVALLAVIGCSDYLVGADVSLLVFYLFPICFATWFVGKRFGVITALLSIGIWSFSNDLASGSRFQSPFVSGWNIISACLFFAVIIILLSNFELFFQSLEQRVAERTLKLRDEMVERQRLEKEILEIGERERRAIGHDLHDTVCQHLTGTRIAVEMLQRKLAAEGSSAAPDANEIVTLIEQAVALTRDFARGLSPVTMTPYGLPDALHDLADQVSQRHGIPCFVEFGTRVSFPDVNAATQLYFIAQEAVTNTVKHARARSLFIRLETGADDWIHLRIRDDGVGFFPDRGSKGMGTRIMAYRAMMIGAEFSIQPARPEGTEVRCSWRNPACGKEPA